MEYQIKCLTFFLTKRNTFKAFILHYCEHNSCTAYFGFSRLKLKKKKKKFLQKEKFKKKNLLTTKKLIELHTAIY